jgi:hypothetical protein
VVGTVQSGLPARAEPSTAPSEPRSPLDAILAEEDIDGRIKQNIRILAKNIVHFGLRPPEEELLGPWLFRTLDAFPSPKPWLRPVPQEEVALPEPWPSHVVLAAAKDGLFHDRYDVTRCPGRYLLDCVQIWATGLFQDAKRPRCVGVQLDRPLFTTKKLNGATLAQCPISRSQGDEKRLRSKERVVLDERAVEQARKMTELQAP